MKKPPPIWSRFLPSYEMQHETAYKFLLRKSAMTRKLRLSKHFTPCPVDDGDEMYPNGIFVFNITKMADYIRINDFPFEDVQVKDFPKPTTKFKDDYLETVDISKPVIVAEISPGRYNVIDGNHRMEKARRLGLANLPAYRIGPEQHMQFFTTEQGYRAYVEYWNGKLKDMESRG
jgi:ParB-like nuclease domain